MLRNKKFSIFIIGLALTFLICIVPVKSEENNGRHRQLAHMFRSPQISSPSKSPNEPYRLVKPIKRRRRFRPTEEPPERNWNRQTFRPAIPIYFLQDDDDPVLQVGSAPSPQTTTSTTPRPSTTFSTTESHLTYDFLDAEDHDEIDPKYKDVLKSDPKYEEYVETVKRHLYEISMNYTRTSTTWRPFILPPRLPPKPKQKTKSKKSKKKSKPKKKTKESEESEEDDVPSQPPHSQAPPPPPPPPPNKKPTSFVSKVFSSIIPKVKFDYKLPSIMRKRPQKPPPPPPKSPPSGHNNNHKEYSNKFSIGSNLFSFSASAGIGR